MTYFAFKEIRLNHLTNESNKLLVRYQNKIANTLDRNYYQSLRDTAAENGLEFYYETNVCAGLPVISTKCGSLPLELFASDPDKYLADIGDYRALAKKSINLLNQKKDKEFYKSLVNRYKKSFICNQYARLLGYDSRKIS